MAVRPNAAQVTILEQIIEDPVSEISLQFERTDNGGTRLSLFGEKLKCGHRVLAFDCDGNFIGGGTHLRECPQPTFIREIG